MSGYNHFRHHRMFTGYAQSKGVPLAPLAVWFTGLMLIFGGVGILLWVYLKFSIILLAVFLLVTTLVMHQYWKVTDQNMRMTEQINFNKNMALLGALLLFFSIPLPWSVS
ncbi:DoxX family protein [Candidatus Nomurabacteria bacterium]|nr:DoxX family protein [Candidatus Nomurabacteria bacterium]